MRVINVRNVCEALPEGIKHLRAFGEVEQSRNGQVLAAPLPVTTLYSHPWERVLFDAARDANPFFHLMESLWMLGGRNHAKYLTLYIKDFADRFAESNGAIHDAYGHRWRQALGFDQLNYIIAMLKKDPATRQAVLQMWDAAPNMNDLQGEWKTRPCNTHAYFRICRDQLDMMVCCRSNDMLYGAYGANAVHFSILQEYIAACVGVPQGRYHQVSNNFHVYQDLWEKLRSVRLIADNRYHTDNLAAMPLVDAPEAFMEELEWLLQGTGPWKPCKNRFISDTAYHVQQAMLRYRNGRKEEALETATRIAALDWRMACTEWLQRRM